MKIKMKRKRKRKLHQSRCKVHPRNTYPVLETIYLEYGEAGREAD